MSEPLATYLHDHLAGAKMAVDLLAVLRDEHAGEPIGRFAAELLADVDADREVLRRLADRVGAPSSPVKEAAAWLAEKITRVKLHRQMAGDFGTFEAVEVLGLGILGKLSLWHALARIARRDERLDGVDFMQLAARAEEQRARTEEVRLGLIASAFNDGAADRSAPGHS